MRLQWEAATPSDSNGLYSLPAGYLAATGETILASQHNPPLEDLAAGMTARLMRSGVAPMTGALKLADGTAGAPALSFASAATRGFHKTTDGIGVDVGGTLVAEFTSAGLASGVSTAAIADKAITYRKIQDPSTTSRLLGTPSVAKKAITGAANNGSAAIRLTVASTTDLTTGQSKTVSGVVGTTEANGTWVITVINGTTVDLDGSTFANAYVSGGFLGGSIEELTLGAGLAIQANALVLTAALPRGYISGCTLSNGSDATNDINIAAGVCRDSSNTADIVVSANTAGKQLDANWAAAATTNTGMRNSAAGIADGTYHIYAARTAASSAATIYAYAGVAGTDPDSSAAIATMLTALQAETGGTDYIYARRIASIMRASAVIRAFKQDGDCFDHVTPILDINRATPGTSANTETLSVPLGIRALATLIISGITNQLIYMSSLDQTDAAPSTTAAPLASWWNAGAGGAGPARVRTNASAQVRSRATISAQLYGVTTGWVDIRGKDS